MHLAPLEDWWQSCKAHFGLAVRLLVCSSICGNILGSMTFSKDSGTWWSDDTEESLRSGASSIHFTTI